MNEKLQLPLLATGVPGLDTVLGGGLPELAFTIIGGAPGSGKTTFAQQIMFSLAGPGKKALFFTAMGEPPVKMLRYQQQFDFFDLAKVGDAIQFISLADEVLSGDYNAVLEKIRKEVGTHQPAYVFIDSFRSFVLGAKGAHQEIHVLQSFVQKLVTDMTGWQATSFLIGEYLLNEADKNPIFTVADGIFWLSQDIQRNAMLRKIQVLKMRGRSQRSGLHSFRINSSGIEVFPRVITGEVGLAKPVDVGNRISTGVAALDAMMDGGLPAGLATLVVGPSGSGKTSLAMAFLCEGLRQGETAVLARFEKPSGPLGSELEALVRQGRVGLLNVRTLDLSLDEIAHNLIQLVEQLGASRVVIDSLSGFELSLAPEFRDDFRESLYRLVTVLAEKGISLFMTCEFDDQYGALSFSRHGAALLADAIIMLRYVEQAGELCTVLGVVKVRGAAHSRQLRRLHIDANGVQIDANPIAAGGVLRGSM